MFGLRFDWAAVVRNAGTWPGIPASGAPMYASALGQGHWALNATFSPSGVDVGFKPEHFLNKITVAKHLKLFEKKKKKYMYKNKQKN
jgi:hypothetical protein